VWTDDRPSADRGAYSRAQWLGLWHDVCELVGIDHTEELEPRPARQRITEGDEADADVKDQAEQAGHHPKTTKLHYIRGHRAVVRLAEKRRA
jgi:hypothetical protein